MIVGARDASGRVRLKLRISPHGAHNVGVVHDLDPSTGRTMMLR
jgi:hypothetical protein